MADDAKIIDEAVEKFRSLMESQLARAKKIKEDKDFTDYDALDTIVIGIVGGALYMLGFIVDDTDILIQLITTVLMLCGFIMIIIAFLLLATDLEEKEAKQEYTEPFIDEYSEFDNCIFDDRQSGWYACLSIAEGTYEKNYKS